MIDLTPKSSAFCGAFYLYIVEVVFSLVEIASPKN